MSGQKNWLLTEFIQAAPLQFIDELASEIIFFQAEDGIRHSSVTGVQTCALPISSRRRHRDSSVTGVQTCALPISSRRRHTRFKCDWSSDVCSSDLIGRAHV